MPERQQIDAGMALLAARFIQRLPERQVRLQAGWAEWQANSKATVPAALIRELHALAGAAPLFGHPALGDQCRALEQALQQADTVIEKAAPAITALFAGITALQTEQSPPV